MPRKANWRRKQAEPPSEPMPNIPRELRPQFTPTEDHSSDEVPVYHKKSDLEGMGLDQLRAVADDLMARLEAIGRPEIEVRARSKNELREEIIAAQKILKRKKG